VILSVFVVVEAAGVEPFHVIDNMHVIFFEGVFDAIYSMDTTVSLGTVTICHGVMAGYRGPGLDLYKAGMSTANQTPRSRRILHRAVLEVSFPAVSYPRYETSTT
jgi:hypothetical protein